MTSLFRVGDAYAIPFLIRYGGTVVTPQNVSSVRIAVGNLTASYPNGTLSFSGECWMFHIAQAQSYKLPFGNTKYQVQIQFSNGETHGSAPQLFPIGDAVFSIPFGKTTLDTTGTYDGTPTVVEIQSDAQVVTAEIPAFSAQIQQSNTPYTTLSRHLYVNPDDLRDRTSRIVVGLHNLDPARTYTLRCYTVSRRKGYKYGVWYSPPDFEEAGEGEHDNVLGYGQIAGTKAIKLNDGYTISFAKVPDWMPNNGILQTKWSVSAGAQTVQIDLATWLLPLCKPYVIPTTKWDGDFPPVDGNPNILLARFIGISKTAHAGKLFRFCLIDDRGSVWPTLNTLNVGAQINSTADITSYDIGVLDYIRISPAVNGKVVETYLHTSIT